MACGRKHYHQCKACNAKFTVAFGTPLEGTHLPMRTWFTALYFAQPELGFERRRCRNVPVGDAVRVQGRLAWETDQGDRSVVHVHSGLLSMRMHRYRHEEPQIDAHSPAPSAGMSKVGSAMQHATSTGTARNAGTVSAKTLRAGRSESRRTPSGLSRSAVETHGGYHNSR
jgi:hypothetical protein